MKQEVLIGRTIAGKYVVEALVGQGAMGAVYKVRQIALGTTLALKILHGHLASDPMFAARFLREAQAASRIDHPSSMRVVDFGEESDGLLYIAMEYVDGRTLAKIIEDEAPLRVSRIVDIASQALAALAVAHDLGVIHRDLKPENIMVLEGKDDEGRVHDIVKVCDFGVAKLLESEARLPNVTAKGLVVGTPEYMSPEQACGEELDTRSDIYAMGVLLFHLMTGKVPFDSSTPFGTAFMHVNDEPTRPRLLNPRVDVRLEKICLKAMRKKPEDRYASARELRSELRALLNDDPATKAPSSSGLLQQIDARPRRSGFGVAAVALAVGVVACGIFYRRSKAADENMQVAVNSLNVASAPMPAVPAPVVAPPAGAIQKEPIAETHETPPPAASANSSPALRTRTGSPKINARRSGGKARGAHGDEPPLSTGARSRLPRVRGAQG